MMKLSILLLQLISLLGYCCQVTGINQVDVEYPITLYVGSYSPPDGTGSGITIFEQDDLTANFNAVGSLFIESPSYMVIDATRTFIYAISELNAYEGQPGILWALRVTHPGGNLTLANNIGIPGYKPCHIALDPTGKFLLISNYGSGNVLVFQLDDTGLVGPRTSDIQAPGDNPSGARAHMARFDPNVPNHVAIAFESLDTVYFYELDPAGRLTPYTVTLTDATEVQVRAEVDPGSGPRHLVYAADGRYFYVINELSSTVTVFQTNIDPDTGFYPQVQTLSTHPEDYSGSNSAAEIALSPNGLFLYASERGDNSIAIYSIDINTGFLTSIGFQYTTGATPRYFVIEPSGSKLYVGNQNGNSIDIFSINAESGLLTLDSTITDIPSPAFILYEEQM